MQCKQYYKNNKALWPLRQLRDERCNLLFRLKQKVGCQECGNRDVRVLQFHHVDPQQKSFRLNASDIRNKTLEEIIDEVRKCKILCANCHIIAHDGKWRS
jgi:hypothetical protein